MDCLVCRRAETRPDTTQITLERESASLTFTDVPAQVCRDCGESYLDDMVTAVLLRSAEEMIEAGVMTGTRSYAVAART